MIKKKLRVPNPIWAKPGFIYFIGTGEAVKIGFASVVTERLSTLQISTHNSLTLLAKVAGTRQLEKEYHFRFREYLIRGEWFRADAEPIRQEIDRINGVAKTEPRPEPRLAPEHSAIKIKPAYIGKLIKLRDRHKGDRYVHERLCIAIKQCRTFNEQPEHQAGLVPLMEFTKRGLAERGVAI